jgi:hypothetical protein
MKNLKTDFGFIDLLTFLLIDLKKIIQVTD